jgi:hypothetical protein
MIWLERRRDRPILARRRMLAAVALAALLPRTALSQPLTDRRLIRVGPTREIRTVAEAAWLARDGDVVEIDAADYRGDAAVWTQRNLTIRGVGGQARLIAAGTAAEGKAIWVVRGTDVRIGNIAFIGARVADRNGAGIRFERGQLKVSHCLFADNEMAILTSNDPQLVLEVEGCEFSGYQGLEYRLAHLLYAGTIRHLAVQGCYFHRGRVGHLIKSRAQSSLVAYNRITDEQQGRSSYELEFPNGGVAIVLGNLIGQGPHTENAVIVSFGAEGYKWPRNELYLSHNTIVNDRPQGATFVVARRGEAAVRATNNLFVGNGVMDLPASAVVRDNLQLELREFAAPTDFDYRLRSGSDAIGKAVDAGEVDGFSLRPAREYVHPLRTAPVPSTGPLSPGAFQTAVP